MMPAISSGKEDPLINLLWCHLLAQFGLTACCPDLIPQKSDWGQESVCTFPPTDTAQHCCSQGVKLMWHDVRWLAIVRQKLKRKYSFKLEFLMWFLYPWALSRLSIELLDWSPWIIKYLQHSSQGEIQPHLTCSALCLNSNHFTEIL